MPRDSHNPGKLQPEVLLKLELGVLLPLSIAVGGASGFMPALHALALVGCVSALLATVGISGWLAWKFCRIQIRAAAAYRSAVSAPVPSDDVGGVVIAGAFPPFEPYPFNLVDAALLRFDDGTTARDRSRFARNRFGSPSLTRDLDEESVAAA